MIDLPRTYGALLAGGLVATGFSGVVTVQCLAYFRNYGKDPLKIKLLVTAVWILDFCHTIFVGVTLWDHLIENFGNQTRIDFVPWSMALTIAFTAVLTFLVHCFFVHRIFKLSLNNYYIAVPLALLASSRLAFACLTTVKLITLRSLALFVDQYTWSFTAGLGLSSLLDVLVTGFLCYLLMSGRKSNPHLNHVLDSLMLYAFENGSLTCASTVVSMVCWLTMPTNLIFMGLHFVISKLYASSLLATLNTRNTLKEKHTSRSQPNSNPPVPVALHTDSCTSCGSNKRFSKYEGTQTSSMMMQINIEKTTVRTVDEGTLPECPV